MRFAIVPFSYLKRPDLKIQGIKTEFCDYPKLDNAFQYCRIFYLRRSNTYLFTYNSGGCLAIPFPNPKNAPKSYKFIAKLGFNAKTRHFFDAITPALIAIREYPRGGSGRFCLYGAHRFSWAGDVISTIGSAH